MAQSGLGEAALRSPSDRSRTFQVASGVYLAFYVEGHMDSVFIFARTYLGIDTGAATAARKAIHFNPGFRRAFLDTVPTGETTRAQRQSGDCNARRAADNLRSAIRSPEVCASRASC